MELAVTINAGGLVADLGTEPIQAELVVGLGERLRGVGTLGYGVLVFADGDGSEDPGRELLDYGLEDEFEAAAAELGLPAWDGPGSRVVSTGPSDPGAVPPYTSVRIVMYAEGPADGAHVDVGRVIWLADRLGGDALLSYGVRFHAQRDLRLDGYILDDAWCEELFAAFSSGVADVGLRPWPIQFIRIQPAHERPAGWAEERRYRPWPTVTTSRSGPP